MKAENLKLLIQAGNPIISMETPDESRAIRLVREVAQASKLPLMEWSVTEGLLTTPPEGIHDAGQAGQDRRGDSARQGHRPIRPSTCSRTSARTARTRRWSARCATSTFRPTRGCGR